MIMDISNGRDGVMENSVLNRRGTPIDYHYLHLDD